MAYTALNAANCGNFANTGVGTCVVIPDLITYAVAVPKGTSVPVASLVDNATFNAYVNAKFIADSRATRWYLLPFISDLKDNTGDPITEKINNFTKTVQSGRYDWTYRMPNIFPCGYQNVYNLMQEMQNYFDIYFIDDKGTWFGTNIDNSGNFYAFSMFEIFVPDYTQKVAGGNPMYYITFRLAQNEQFSKNALFMASQFVVSSTTQQLSSVKLIAGPGTVTATHLFVNGTLGCGGSNLGSVYGATLAATAVWKVNNAATGAVITVSAVSYDSILNQYDLTITSTPGASVIVAIAAPSIVTPSPYGAYVVTETPDKLTVATP